MNDDLEREGPPPELKSRVIDSLRQRGVLRPRGWGARPAGAGAARRVAAVAAGLALFAAGALVGRGSRAAPGPDNTAMGVTPTGALPRPLPQFLVVLEEPASFQPDRALADLVREYGAWAGELGREGRLVAAEELDGWSAVLPADDAPGAPEGSPATAMTGFFLVRAEDRDAALALARTHPHLGYGGRVVVLGVVGGS